MVNAKQKKAVVLREGRIVSITCSHYLRPLMSCIDLGALQPLRNRLCCPGSVDFIKTLVETKKGFGALFLSFFFCTLSLQPPTKSSPSKHFPVAFPRFSLYMHSHFVLRLGFFVSFHFLSPFLTSWTSSK